MSSAIASALRIARRYGQRYAEGGMTLKRTEPFPEAPEGYEYYAPADDPGPGNAPPQQQAEPSPPDWAHDEYALQRQQAEALPERPPVAMEPDLNATQMREQDIPEGYAVNDAGILFNKQTGEELSTTRRPGVLPITKTPEGRYEAAMPKVADIFGNMGGGWSAPVSGAETILGAGVRIPRGATPNTGNLARDIANSLVRVHGNDGSALAAALDHLQNNARLSPATMETIFNHLPEEARYSIKTHDAYADKPKFAPERPEKPVNLDEFFGMASPSQVEHLNDSEVLYLARQISDSGADYYMKDPDLYTALMKRVEQIRENETPQSAGQRNFGSLDELEQAYNRITGGEHPNVPTARGQNPESYDQAIARMRREREEGFNTNYTNYIAPHFGDRENFLNTYFAGKHDSDMEVTWDQHGGFRFEGPLRDKDGTPLASISRDFDPVNKTAHHGYWRVQNDQRGTGIVPTVLKNQVDVYKKLGIERVFLNANIDVGSYAWAKYGWIPTQTEWHYMAQRFKDRVAMFNISAKEKEAVLAILDNPNPKAIWDLADSTIPKGPGSNMTIGKALMLNGSWNGTLHLNDADSMARFNEYVAKKIATAKKGKDK